MQISVYLVIYIVLLSSAAKGRNDRDVEPAVGETDARNGTVKDTNTTRISSLPIFIILSMDGFRYDYFTKADTPNLNWVKEHGVFAPYMKPQFPTKTFPNHHSISTGLHPESHGVIDNVLFDPLFNETLGVKDEKFWVYSPDVVPLWVLNELSGGVSGTMMYPGSLYGYGHSKTKASYIVDYNPSIPFNSRVDTVLTWITHETKPANLVFCYFEEPDEYGHGFGPDSIEVKTSIERVDNVTGYLISKLRELNILDQVNLVFLSDHGFENVQQSHIINISSLVNPKRYKFDGGSPNYLIYPQEGEEINPLYDDLKRASIGNNFSVYLKHEVAVKKPNWFYSHGRRLSPILLVADLGYVFDDFYDKISYYEKKYNISANDTKHVYGTHGYDNSQKPMQPFFRAIGPVFQTGGVEVEPFDNIDLFPLLCQLLKIHTPPNNGSLPNSLLKALKSTSSSDSSSAIAWIVGGLLIGVAILVVIFMTVGRWRRRGRYFYENGNSVNGANGSTVAYRYALCDHGEDLVSVDENRNTGNLDCTEGRALLSLSDESIDHQNA